MTLQRSNCADDKQVLNIKKEIADIENAIKRLDNHEAKYSAEFEQVLAEYMGVSSKALDFEQVEFDNIRQKARATKEQIDISQIKSTYGDKFSHEILSESKQELQDF